MGTILTMTRDQARGTMENLLARPVRPLLLALIGPFILANLAQGL